MTGFVLPVSFVVIRNSAEKNKFLYFKGSKASSGGHNFKPIMKTTNSIQNLVILSALQKLLFG